MDQQQKYIVKPVYLRLVHNGPTDTRIFAVYDTTKPTLNDDGALIPNHVLRGGSWDALPNWFRGMGVLGGCWRLTIPTFGHVDELDVHSHGREIIDI